MEYNVSSLLQRASPAQHANTMIDDDIVVDGSAPPCDRRAYGLDRTPRGHLRPRPVYAGEMPDECSRCLKPHQLPDRRSTSKRSTSRSIDVNTGARITPPEGEEDAYRINERHILDLRRGGAAVLGARSADRPGLPRRLPGPLPRLRRRRSAPITPAAASRSTLAGRELANLQL